MPAAAAAVRGGGGADADRCRQLDRDAGRGVVEGADAAPRAGRLQQADQLGSPAAGASGTDAGELPSQLAGDQHAVAASAGGGGRLGDRSPLAWPLGAILLLDPHQRRRQLGRIVVMGVGDVDEVLLDDRHLEALEAPDVDLHRLPQPALGTPRVVVVVQQDVVEEAVPDMLDQRLEVLRGGVEAGLARLGRDVADVGADPVGGRRPRRGCR